jgi:hypothetical protein
MVQRLLLASCFTAALLLTCGAHDASARGPKGPGGPSGGHNGARPSGGMQGQNRSLGQSDAKKKKKPSGGAQKNSKFDPNQFKPHNGSKNSNNRSGKQGSSKLGGLDSGKFNPQQFQASARAENEKWQPGQDALRVEEQGRRQNQSQNHDQNPARDLQHAGKPFTADWYAAHPNAWQQANPHADAWAVTSAAGVAAWLGWASQPTYGTSNTVVYQQAPVEETETNYAYDNSTDTTSDGTTADDTDSAASDWLTIGVYSILAKSGENTSRLLQLACNRQGDLRGVEYDSISGESQNLTGRIDQSTQIATWQLDSNPQTTFRANLSSLTNSTGTIEVSQQGTTTQWRIARQENGG